MTIPFKPQARALKCHQVIRDYGDDLVDSNLIDLLSDAMHWCKAYGHSFERCLLMARHHFEQER